MSGFQHARWARIERFGTGRPQLTDLDRQCPQVEVSSTQRALSDVPRQIAQRVPPPSELSEMRPAPTAADMEPRATDFRNRLRE